MKTKDTVHGQVAFRFAEALFRRDFRTAHSMLCVKLKSEYPPEVLRQRFEQMMTLSYGKSELPDVQVMDNNEAAFDAEGWAYVAIESEAVIVTVDLSDPSYRIRELEWGRP